MNCDTSKSSNFYKSKNCHIRFTLKVLIDLPIIIEHTTMTFDFIIGLSLDISDDIQSVKRPVEIDHIAAVHKKLPNMLTWGM